MEIRSEGMDFSAGGAYASAATPCSRREYASNAMQPNSVAEPISLCDSEPKRERTLNL